MDTKTINNCGTCTACCFTHSVCTDDLKPLTKLFEHCQHCTQDSGCSIYASRPEGCRVYKCLWLSGSQSMSHSLRPDRLGIVIDAHTLKNISVTLFLFWEVNTDALQKPNVHQLIEKMIAPGNKIILTITVSKKLGIWFAENLNEQAKKAYEDAVEEFLHTLLNARRDQHTRPDS